MNIKLTLSDLPISPTLYFPTSQSLSLALTSTSKLQPTSWTRPLPLNQDLEFQNLSKYKVASGHTDGKT
jgi:hypothetical protein